MCRVFVLSKNKKKLMPCLPARARKLLSKKKAKVFKFKPFTIILTEREEGETQKIEYKVDPGSKQTGISLIAHFTRGKVLIFAINIEHKGQTIKNNIEKRKHIRRSRRNRKTRYRASRFNNRTRKKGWLPPSLMSRVGNVKSWAIKIMKFCPTHEFHVETVRFDTQKLENAEISGIEYSQGDLLGYEIREYLLEKGKRTCAYCDVKHVSLEVDHIIPKSKGGSNRVSNLTLACKACNQKKGNSCVTKFVEDKERLKKILSRAKKPLKDAAAVNATRYMTGNVLKSFGLPTFFWSGALTKKNRYKQSYQKDHWIDAACVGESGKEVIIPKKTTPLIVKAEGRGTRQMCRVDKYGFPRTTAKNKKEIKGFQTGDIVKALVPKGKKIGTYIGRVAIRKTGNFNIKIGKKTIEGINARYCKIMQKTDGYLYV